MVRSGQALCPSGSILLSTHYDLLSSHPAARRVLERFFPECSAAPERSLLTAKTIFLGQKLPKWYNPDMSLQITIPPQLEQVIAKRAAELGVDVQTYVVDTLSESLSESLLASVLSSEFIAQLDRISELHISAPATFDDSRESIYLGCGE